VGSCEVALFLLLGPCTCFIGSCAIMAPAGVLASPPLRHANSEGRLVARRRVGSAILGLPGLKPCSSEAPGGPQHCDSKVLSSPISRRRGHDEAVNLTTQDHDGLSSLQDRLESGYRAAASRAFAAGTGSESRTSLPPIFENDRGMVRQLTSPQDRLRPAKRSRSSTAVCDAQKDNSIPMFGSKLELPALSCSRSTGALAISQIEDTRSKSEIEQVLANALSLSGEQRMHTAFQEQCNNELEAHLQELIDIDDD